MSVKYFCDVCGDELLEDSFPNQVPENKQVKFLAPNGKTVVTELAIGVSDNPTPTFHEGELCHDCLFRSLTDAVSDTELDRKRNKTLLNEVE